MDYVQFGCGLCAPGEWRNFDAGPAFWLQKYFPFLTSVLKRNGFPEYPVRLIEYGDVIAGLPIKQQSAQAVYCSHVLEHLSLDELRGALRNVFKYLRPGGVFRLVVPDLAYYVQRYAESTEPDAAMRFLRETHLGRERSHRGLRSWFRLAFGRSDHLWMWDYPSMEKELAEAGFVDIRRANFNDSSDPRFREVEEMGRWENCLGMECRRPAA
jgi:predicted SAM-dependent methyltransferase